MTPLQQYQLDIKQPGFQFDAMQFSAINKLQNSYDILSGLEKYPEVIQNVLRKRKQQQISLYLWGKVGRGKTYLMDSFYNNLPIQEKQRLHFYRFMKDIHNHLSDIQGTLNPLRRIAKDISKTTKVLCFDEFFVNDISDAMILGKLFIELFKQGVCVIMTSNINPDGLYKDGLHRDRFLPAVSMLKQSMTIFHMDGAVDYRLRSLSTRQCYHVPANSMSDKMMLENFSDLNQGVFISNQTVVIENRNITSRHLGQASVWFDFSELCEGPRSANDYIALAEQFNTVFISNIPVLGGRLIKNTTVQGVEDNSMNDSRNLDMAHNDDAARRFISLVDEFYDKGINLVISAEMELKKLYKGGKLSFEFNRTISRLTEMQSIDYLDGCG